LTLTGSGPNVPRSRQPARDVWLVLLDIKIFRLEENRVWEVGSGHMKLTINGTQIDIGDSLRSHVTDRLTDAVVKYFDNPISGDVSFSREGHQYRVECSVHVGGGILLESHAVENDITSSFDIAAYRIEKRLRRYKRRLRSHHDNHKEVERELLAQSYVLAPEVDHEEEPENLAPIIIADTRTEIPTLTVGEAVMRMELSNSGFLMFHNRGHDGLNLVFQRPDGNIGWIDPQGNQSNGEQN